VTVATKVTVAATVTVATSATLATIDCGGGGVAATILRHSDVSIQTILALYLAKEWKSPEMSRKIIATENGHRE